MLKKRHSWFWTILFIGTTLLLGSLATGWNVVLIRDYQHLLALARNLSLPAELNHYSTNLMIKLIVGTLGFIAALGFTVLLFIKLFKEMKLNQIQSEFLATVSHELKTPIAAIELSSNLIQAGGLDEEELRRLWRLHQIELKRLKEEVETLLQAARWQAKPPKNIRTRIQLEMWIQDSFSHWKILLGTNAILCRQGESLPFEIYLDLQTLKTVTDNLLNNAKKFSRGNPHVIIRTRRILKDRPFAKPKWQISFEDDGWGFDPSDSRKIFHRFFRSKSHAPYAIPGTGLGLYLASAACRAMGLSLQGHSKGAGQGAVFILEGIEDSL